MGNNQGTPMMGRERKTGASHGWGGNPPIPVRYQRGTSYMHGPRDLYLELHQGEMGPEIRTPFVPTAWPVAAMTIHARAVGAVVRTDDLPWFPEWTTRAACKEADPELFFPRTVSRRNARAAKRYCEGCPVRMECLTDNLDVPFGIFGGFNERERWKLSGRTDDPHREGLRFFSEWSAKLIREVPGNEQS